MIFLDATGKRWQKIKRSTALMALAGAMPVAVLAVGSFTYQPQWDLIKLARQAGNVFTGTPKPLSSGGNGPNNSQSSSKTQPRRTSSGVGSSPSASSAATASSTSTPTSTSTQPTTTPSTTPTLPQSSSPTRGDPLQNDFGQSHKPTR